MSPHVTRFVRIILWMLLTVLVLLATTVTALRITLPQLNRVQSEIVTWVNDASGLQFTVQDVHGFWRNTHPSLSLKNVEAVFPEEPDTRFVIDNIEVEFDLIQTIVQREPVVADLVINGMILDIRSVDLLPRLDTQSTPSSGGASSGGEQLVSKLDTLLLRQLDRFAITKSTIIYRSISSDIRQLDIEKLRWRNQQERHLAEGVVSIADANLNALSVRADFIDHGSLASVSGDFYVSASHVSVKPWLTNEIRNQTGIDGGFASFNSWLTLDKSTATEASIELLPSELTWNKGKQHDLVLESGFVQLLPSESGWQINGHEFQLRSNEVEWPELDFALLWNRNNQWQLNVSQLDVEALRPLAELAPDDTATQWLERLNFGGRIEDIRASQLAGTDSFKYSATFSQLSMAQWKLLPEFHNLSGTVSGSLEQATARLNMIDDRLPYGDVFQAPLVIKQGQVDIVWQKLNDNGWSLWADKITVATPDLQVLGAFRLDFPKDKSPFLSFYAEADLHNAGETWRYLPTLALGQNLTDYLSAALQGGRVNTSKLLWFGQLSDFPYQSNNGMFQAWVGLKDAKFSFATDWPLITNLQLDLLFQNDAMHLDSHAADLMNVKAKRITGRIPRLSSSGHIEIEAKATADGGDVRDYMTSSPLVDSVGAALTAVQISGDVDADFQLYIPFAKDEKEARAWGYAELTDNHVEIKAPPMTLENVSGRVAFDNDVVKTAGLSGELLKQPITLDFSGQNAGKGYAVNIDAIGDWNTKPLIPYIGERWVKRVKGHAPWQMGIELQLNDVGFTYQLDLNANFATLVSEYPYPLAKGYGDTGFARLQASGNQQSITARLQLPSVKYQTEIDITGEQPVLKATNLVLGKGGFKISPIVGHHFQVRTDKFNLDDWMSIAKEPVIGQKAVLDGLNTPSIPLPERVRLDVNELMLGSIEWHDVDFNARKKKGSWQFDVDSQEVKGQANLSHDDELLVSLQRLHVFVPDWDDTANSDESIIAVDDPKAPLISDFEKQFHAIAPDTKFTIDNFWFQGYKVGKIDMEMAREQNSLVWKKLQIKSGTNHIDLNGRWTLTDDDSETEVKLLVKGENNSDLMERFGITSGIQRAPFELESSLAWKGSPWNMRVETVNGEMKTELGKGVISDVSGAARLLGLFSLDSIIRKMQLDFTDVFDKGMAFNSIKGSGKIQNGVFLTNNIKMDAVAGEMTIKGLGDLTKQTVDAEVNFVPDMTSGIPVLTAFAVTPQTALVVLAVTTVIQPVIEVVTQVNYEVKGPLDSPTVREISRSKGEFTLPENYREDK